MWTSNITNSSRTNGSLIITVEYSDGTSFFSDTIDMTGGTLDVLNVKIQSRLDTLNATDDLHAQITTGPFTPQVPPPSPEDVLMEKVVHLEQVKRLSDLGLIPDDSAEITTATSDAQAAVQPSIVSDL